MDTKKTKKILVLGVCGSVAAYRAADVAREVMRAGWSVHVCLTDAAAEFVQPALFEALTGNPVLSSVFDDKIPGVITHIDLARRASVVAIVPATAHTLALLAQGQAPDMLTSLCLAATCPIVAAPAMNPAMYAAEATQASITTLKSRGVVFVEPSEGEVACGETGTGKLAENAQIVEAILAARESSDLLKGKRVLITCGPTVEPIDSVRFLSNRSSGKMGLALARAAIQMGANVTVVHGPISGAIPYPATSVPIQTAQQMLDACLRELSEADIVIGAAAVADYRPANPMNTKLRRSNEPLDLHLLPNTDIISELAKQAKPGTKVIAFAAEPGLQDEDIVAKLKRKGVAGVAANDISRSDIGFGSDSNELAFYTVQGKVGQSGKQSKLMASLWLFRQIATLP